MSALGDRIIEAGPYVANVSKVPIELVASEWNALRAELIELRALRYDHDKLQDAFTLACRSRDLNKERADKLAEVKFNTDDIPAMPGPPVTRVDPVEAWKPDAMAVVDGDRDAYRWEPGEWRGVGPDTAPPCGTCGLPFTDATVEARRCACVDGTPPVKGGLRKCPVCRSVLIGPMLVECTSCAGREDAAAKRAADQ